MERACVLLWRWMNPWAGWVWNMLRWEFAWFIMLCQVPKGFWDPRRYESESRRVAELKANGFVHFGSHLLLRKETALFFRALKLAWLSVPFQKQMYLYPQSHSSALLHGLVPKKMALFLVRVFPFLLFYFFFFWFGGSLAGHMLEVYSPAFTTRCVQCHLEM